MPSPKSVSFILSHIDKNSRSKLRLSDLRRHLTEQGKWWVLETIKVADLRSSVVPTGKENMAVPIVIGRDKEIIDGRHRVAMAQKKGLKKIQSYVPYTHAEMEIKMKARKKYPYRNNGAKWGKIALTKVGKNPDDKFINFAYIEQEIKAKKLAIPDVPGLGNFRYQGLPGKLRDLLGTSAKVSKSCGPGIEVGQLFLSPHKEAQRPSDDFFPTTGKGWRYHAGKKWDKRLYGIVQPQKPFPDPRLNPQGYIAPNTCTGAGKCALTCLLATGNIKLETHARTRYAKTWFWYTQPIVFLRLLIAEIRIHSKRARLKGKKFYVRLNGMSDIMWERYLYVDKLVRSEPGFGGLYDYTKHSYFSRVGMAPRIPGGVIFPKNYALVYSWDEKKKANQYASEWMLNGGSISVVYPVTQQHQADGMTDRFDFVVDGGLNDCRFLDPARSMVLLYSKGNLAGEVRTSLEQCGNQDDLLTPMRVIKKMIINIQKMDRRIPPPKDLIRDYSKRLKYPKPWLL